MIITRLRGGMGNQMFQYAIGRALSIKKNTKLGLDLAFLLDRTPRPKFHKFTFRDYNLDVFNIKAEIIPQSNIPFIYRQFFSGRFMLYVNGFINLFDKKFNKWKYHKFNPCVFNKGTNMYLNGDWHNLKYFEDIHNIIRKDFTPKKELKENIKKLKFEIENNNSLCIHIRRGDYVGNINHEIVGREYYKKGPEKIKTFTKIDKVYVFSDDIKWCEDNIKFELPTMYVGEEYAGDKDVGHMILMLACHNFIIPNSSFAWWGAWLSPYNNKIVVAPKRWFVDININSGGLIPKDWILI